MMKKNKTVDKAFKSIAFCIIFTIMMVLATGSITFAQVKESEIAESETAVQETIRQEEKEIRYPNKLSPKPAAKSNNTSSTGNIDTNKGVLAPNSKARASVTENVDNANKEYPIHHTDASDNKDFDKYSADARQFITFQTKNGKTFHLIINHDEKSENVMLLTEVSEDDLLNMVDKKEKEAIKEEINKLEDTQPAQETKKEEVKETKKEEQSGNGVYLFLGIIAIGVVGVGYYFKVYKKKNEIDEEDTQDYDELEDDYEKDKDNNEEMSNEQSEEEIENMAINAYEDDEEE